LETALPLTLALVEEGVLSLESAIEKLSAAPARAFSLAKGTLLPGADADVAIIDPQAQWEVDPGKFRSKSRNTPFAGWKVKGLVMTTIVGGSVVFEAAGSA
jgi:dihydroorotase